MQSRPSCGRRVSSGSFLLSGHTEDYPSQTPAVRWGRVAHRGSVHPVVACHCPSLTVASMELCVAMTELQHASCGTAALESHALGRGLCGIEGDFILMTIWGLD